MTRISVLSQLIMNSLVVTWYKLFSYIKGSLQENQYAFASVVHDPSLLHSNVSFLSIASINLLNLEVTRLINISCLN